MTTALVPHRSFLGRVLAGLAGLAVLDRPARAVTPPRRRETVGLHEANVFGLPYHDAPRVLPTLRTGDRLVLRRERDNPHDRLAVEVLTPGGAKLGYLAHEDVEVAARLLDAGHPVEATLLQVRPNGWQRLTVALHAELPPARG
jgi:hypothetical protein